MTKKYLDAVYELEDTGDTKGFYDNWSATYDAEVAENGYVTPARAATALSDLVTDKSAPLLDIGCGTGVSGAAFHAAGFTTIDGTDFSEEMLAQARTKGIYRTLTATDLSDPLPFEPGAYTNVAAIGVLNPGHAPAETIDDVLARLAPGGRFVFSLNDHALEDPSYEGRLREHIDSGNAVLEVKDYGDHLPKIGLSAMVYVLRKS